MSEILPVEGADFAGLIPDELQQVATVVVVMTEHMENPEAARKLVEFLSSDAAATVIQSTGLMPVALDEPPQVKVITSGGFTAAFDILGSIFESKPGISTRYADTGRHSSKILRDGTTQMSMPPPPILAVTLYEPSREPTSKSMTCGWSCRCSSPSVSRPRYRADGRESLGYSA